MKQDSNEHIENASYSVSYISKSSFLYMTFYSVPLFSIVYLYCHRRANSLSVFPLPSHKDTSC